MALITYDDKEQYQVNPLPDVNKVTSDDMNEIKTVVNTNAGILITREFQRAWSEELIFDKNEIDYEPHTLTGDVTYTVGSGNLSDEFSTAIQTVVFDGTQAINFSGFQFIYGITNGDVPEAGTYQVFFMYRNGVASVNWVEPSFEVANLAPLSAPANFAAVADGLADIDLTWDTVANASSYEIYQSSTGTGSWTILTVPDAGDVSYTHSGLGQGVTVFYRIRAIGDGVIYANSLYSTASATTETSGDVTAPTFIFSPTSGATNPPINQPIVITANEPIRKDDATVLTDANIASVLRVKQTNVAGSDIAFTATIDAGKTIITITPTTHWGVTQLVYVDIDNVEDVNGNEITLTSSTFTTTDFTLTVGNTFLDMGTQLEAFIAGADVNFELELVIKNAVLSGLRTFFAKINLTTSSAWRWIFQSDGADIFFKFYGTGGTSGSQRAITWAGALTSAETKVTLKYFGAVDTNNGLDRVDLYIDDVLDTGKSVTVAGGSMPFDIPSNSAPLYIGRPFGEIKDIKVRSNFGANLELDIPVMRDGEDVSGNNRDGIWTLV